MHDLSSRARRILFAAVSEYIATGAPVGSRTLSRHHGLDLSAASIRNVLSDLEETGYLIQPHTSAGRIPSDRAFRLFIDTLINVRDVAPDEKARLAARVREIYASSDDPLRESGRMLSELSGAAGVVAALRPDGRTLAQVRFIPTRRDQLLAVLVFEDGTVENRFIRVETPVPDSELTRIHNLLTDVVEGRTLRDIRELFARRLADDRVAADAFKRKAFQMGRDAVEGVSSGPGAVVIEGQTRLMGLPEYSDVDRLKRLVVMLEEREELVGLLDKTLAAGAVTVFVGSETGELAQSELSLVVAPYAEQGKLVGAVGVLGPTRMDYAKVMPLVDATAAAMSEANARRSAKGQGASDDEP